MNATLTALFPSLFRLPEARRIAARRAGRVQRIAPAPLAAHTLDKGATLVIAHPAGGTISCRSGRLWITHDGDGKDIVLEAGQSHIAERSSRMLVHALLASSALVAN
jgi:hypothetical protein